MSKLWIPLGGVNSLQDAWFLGVIYWLSGFPVRASAQPISDKGWLLFFGLLVYGTVVFCYFDKQKAWAFGLLGFAVFLLIALSKTFWVTPEKRRELLRW
jgi:hypothetical protein